MKIRDYLKDETIAGDVVTVDKKLTVDKNINTMKRSMGFDKDMKRIKKDKEKLQCPKCLKSDVEMVDKFPNSPKNQIFGHCNYCGYEGYWQEFVIEDKE